MFSFLDSLRTKSPQAKTNIALVFALFVTAIFTGIWALSLPAKIAALNQATTAEEVLEADDVPEEELSDIDRVIEDARAQLGSAADAMRLAEDALKETATTSAWGSTATSSMRSTTTEMGANPAPASTWENAGPTTVSATATAPQEHKAPRTILIATTSKARADE